MRLGAALWRSGSEAFGWPTRLRRSMLWRRSLRTHPEPRLHLGCGQQVLDGWLNADLEPTSRDVVPLDARRPFPFQDRSFGLVYSEHLIEHLELDEGEHMLRECWRTLRPGGVIRIATPDLGFLVRLYASRNDDRHRDYVSWASRRFELPDRGTDGFAIVVNHFFHAWGHRFIYDPETLAAALRAAGFVEIHRVPLGKSQYAALRGLERHGRVIPAEFNALETFVLEARRPDEPASA